MLEVDKLPPGVLAPGDDVTIWGEANEIRQAAVYEQALIGNEIALRGYTMVGDQLVDRGLGGMAGIIGGNIEKAYKAYDWYGKWQQVKGVMNGWLSDSTEKKDNE